VVFENVGWVESLCEIPTPRINLQAVSNALIERILYCIIKIVLSKYWKKIVLLCLHNKVGRNLTNMVGGRSPVDIQRLKDSKNSLLITMCQATLKSGINCGITGQSRKLRFSIGR